MTPAELAELIQQGPSAGLIEALAPLSEKERKALSKGVVELRKHYFAGGQPGVAWIIGEDPAVSRLKLAMLAVGPWGEVQRIRVWHVVRPWKDGALTQGD